MADFRYGARSSAELMMERLKITNEQRVRKGMQVVPQSFVGDGEVENGSNVVIRHVLTNSVLTNDLWTEVAPREYKVFAQVSDQECRRALAQSTFVIVKVAKKTSCVLGTSTATYNRQTANKLHFGQEFQLMCNPSLLVNEKADMLSAACFLKAEGGMGKTSHTLSMTYDQNDPKTHFVCVPSDSAKESNPLSKTLLLSQGKPVPCNVAICLKNVMSNLPVGVEFTFRNKDANIPDGQVLPASCSSGGTNFPTGSFQWKLEFTSNREDSEDTRSLPQRIVKPKELIRKIKDVICERGGHHYGIRDISRTFQIMDSDKSGSIEPEELLLGLSKYGIQLDQEQINSLFGYLDENGDKRINLSEFLIALRGPINKRRLKMILMAYDVLDQDQNQIVTLDEIAKLYDTSWHPAVIDKTKSHEDVIKEFIEQWDNGGSSKNNSSGKSIKGDGVITKDEFIHFYRDVSASIDDDDYFELMMRNAWHISGGTGWCENTSNIRALVEFNDGSEKIIELRNDFGISRQDMPEIRAALRRQGVKDFKRVSLAG